MVWSQQARGTSVSLPTAIAAATNQSTGISANAKANEGKDDDDDDDVVAKRIIVKGDVQGGYVRACVLNEAGRFRRLVGTMTDPDPASDTAEIYVEGKGKLVDGFVRWCQRGKVGLSQTLSVLDVIDEEPTGLYESFYCKTK
jgi:acylphosphatase